jgi:hypothetical protein
MAGLVVMLMVSWGILGTLQRLTAHPEEVVGRMHGKEVTQGQVSEAVGALFVFLRLGIGTPQALWYLQTAAATPTNMATYIALSRDMSAFVFAKGDQADIESAWRFLLLEREAAAAGVQLSADEVESVLILSPLIAGRQGVDPGAYRRFLEMIRMSDADVTRAVTQLGAVAKLLRLRRESVRASTADVWMAYTYEAQRAKVRLVEVPVQPFESLIKPTEEELRKFYEQHKDAVADPVLGKVGYMAPERAKVEYAMSPIDEAGVQAQLTDQEVEAYYRQNRREFLEKLPEGEEPPAAQPDATPEEAPPKGYRFQSLDEARDAVRQRLAKRKAHEEALTVANQVVEELDRLSGQYPDMPLPLSQIARRHGLVYTVARGADEGTLLSSEELAGAMPQGAQVAAFAFDPTGNLYYPKVFDDGEAPLVCQVTQRAPAEALLFEAVVARVRSDYEDRQALERASVFAGKLKEQAAQTTLGQAAKEMQTRLNDLVNRPAAERLTLEVRETGFFSRRDEAVPGLEGSHRGLAEAALRLKPGEFGVATEGAPAPGCFVVELTETQPASPDEFAERGAMLALLYEVRKQNEAVREWMESLYAASPRPAKASGG